jgi:hypothetical protein
MIRYLALALALLTIISTQAHAESKSPPPSDGECFWIFTPNKDSMLGSILLNRCTGESAMLRPVETSGGKLVWRWFKLDYVRQEYEMGPAR